MNFTFTKLQHVGIPVTNIRASEAFYNRLGFTNVMNSSFVYNGGTGTVIMMQKNEILIEIYEMPENELSEIKTRKAGNIDHIAFDVVDIDIAFAELKKASFQVVEEEPVFLPFWKNGCRYFNILGPDGERIEFNQILL